MRISRLVGLAFFLLPAGLWAEPATDAPRVTAHELTVRFDPPRHRLVAHDVLTIAGGSKERFLRLRLAPSLRVNTMEFDGNPLPSIRDEDGTLAISVPAGGTHELSVRYAGEIADAVEKSDDLTWVVGDNTSGFIGPQGIYLSDASGWVPLPLQRTPAKFNVKTIVPKPFMVVTQGGPVARVESTTRGFDPASDVLNPTEAKRAEGPETTWEHAAHPATIPTDGLSLSAGPYVQKSRDVEGVKLSTFFYERHAKHADVWLDAGEETIRRYAKLIGKLPHTKFDVVENFFQSGYGMPAYTLLGDKVIDYVTAKARRHAGKIPPGYLDHEYVHCWFGNGLFVDYGTGNWCEALTTYYSNYLARELESAAQARAYRRGVLEKFAIRVKGDADYPLRRFVTKTEDADNDVGYGKGAMFFHMLRRRVGDKAFFDGVRSFTAKHMGSIVTWDQWLAAFDRDGVATALRPFLERAGVPDVWLKVKKTEAVASGTHVVVEVWSIDDDGKAWPTHVPTRITYRGKGGATQSLDIDVAIQDGPALLDVVVGGVPTAVEADPDFHMLRRIPEAALPHCLNRTLESAGEKVLVVDAPEGLLDGLADRIARGKGFTPKPADFDWEDHKGPVVVLRVLAALPEGGVDIAGEHFDDPTLSLLRSWGAANGPRTEYVALTPDAARRAGYATYYGWDSWVRFHNGIPRDRRTQRPTPPTRIVLQEESAASARADEWVRALSQLPRAPGTRSPVLERQLESALGVLEPVEIRGDFHLPTRNRATKAALHYVLGSHQGTLEGPHVRALSFSGSGTTRWLSTATLRPIRWDPKQSTPQVLFERIRNRPLGALILADKASWNALAPWLDAYDNLTEASKAELEKPLRDGKPRPRPPSLEAWIAGRRARAGLPSQKPISKHPVLCVRDDVLPQKASNQNGPLGAIEELSIEVENTCTLAPARNLLAWKPPTARARAPGIQTPVIVLSAHYDSLPWRDAARFRGADDNASGVACLLEVARNLAKGPGARDVGIVFALTDAQEWGLYGARALRAQLATKFDVRAVINVDSIGRAISKPCHVIGHSTYPPLAKRVAAALAAEDLELGSDIDRSAYKHGSDHYPFHQVGIPAVSLWASDYAVMHTVNDVPEKVEARGIARIAQALTTLLRGDLAWILKME